MNEKLLEQYFKDLAEIKSKQVPQKGHHKRFQKRLLRSKKQQGQRRNLLRIAAVALILIGVGIFPLHWESSNVTKEIYAFELTESYMNNMIQTQLATIEAIEHPSTSKIILDTKLQIERMQANYSDIYIHWKEEPSQPQLLNALIANLKKQVDLLTELQEHLLQLQTKKHENELL